MSDSAPWINRIIGTGAEDPTQLLANPKNWRIHPRFQQRALTSVLDKIGWVQDVIVNRETGYVLDGHLRVALAITNQEPEIPVSYVELNEAEEDAVLASLDSTSALAVADPEALDKIMQSDVQAELEALFAPEDSGYEDASNGAYSIEDFVNPGGELEGPDNGDRDYVVMCPACGHEFSVAVPV